MGSDFNVGSAGRVRDGWGTAFSGGTSRWTARPGGRGFGARGVKRRDKISHRGEQKKKNSAGPSHKTKNKNCANRMFCCASVLVRTSSTQTVSTQHLLRLLEVEPTDQILNPGQYFLGTKSSAFFWPPW